VRAPPPADLERLVQFCHPEKILAATRLPGTAALDDARLAELYGAPVARCRALRASFERAARRTARDLLGCAGVRRALAALPLPPGGRLLAVGDSITDDRQSWAEILRWVLAETHGADTINGGLSGDTTAGTRARLDRLTAARPDWIAILIGTNDARRHGGRDADPLVSQAETRRNLAALYRAAARACDHVTLITPPPVLEDRIAAWPEAREARLAWRAEDVAARAELVRRLPGPVVDVWPAFGSPPDPALLLADGLHPSLAGQRRIAHALLGGYGAARWHGT
jgi:acyl-CoA thioesterase I